MGHAKLMTASLPELAKKARLNRPCAEAQAARRARDVALQHCGTVVVELVLDRGDDTRMVVAQRCGRTTRKGCRAPAVHRRCGLARRYSTFICSASSNRI